MVKDLKHTEAQNLSRLIDVGIALSSERNPERLMELILLEAKDLSHADGGTLYLRTDDDRLKFTIMRTDSLDMVLGGTSGKEANFQPLDMYDPVSGDANHTNVASHVALTGRSVNIPNAYSAENFDFSGTKKFDKGTGYRSQSFLTIPLKNHKDRVIGVIQLLNCLDADNGEIIPFSQDIQPTIEALCSLASVALSNQLLIDEQRKLIDAFIQLIASAIDAKSPYTGAHCQRVPELTKMLTKAACSADYGSFRDFDLNEDQWYELHIASWLHDCGKVTTPEYIADKATKLETIYDRIHEVRMRFEVLKRDAEIAYYKGLTKPDADEVALKAEFDATLESLDNDFAFVAECNVGGEFMAPEKIARLRQIADRTWMRTLSDRIGISYEEGIRKQRYPEPTLPNAEKLLDDKPEHILDHDNIDLIAQDNPWHFNMDVPEYKLNLGELYNLAITRGTLTPEERYIINDHIVQTIVMLESLPFPRHLAKVPEYAGGHHEKMDGSGYPRGLKKNEMSIPARIMAVADIFEALTAADRPYKTPKKLSESIDLMSKMKQDAHIDAEIFELFLQSGVYKLYAERFLLPEQIDDVDIRHYLSGAMEEAS